MSAASLEMYSVAPDAELVAAARLGSRSAFTTLIERHKDLVYSLAFAVTGSPAQSEEVVQETFITVWRRLSEMQHPERFRGWVCGIARLAGLGLRRDERRWFLRLAPLSFDLQSEIPSGEPSPLDHAIRREEEAFVWRALGDMPEKYRLPLVLFYAEQQSVARVAEALGISDVVVEKRLSRGRGMLQKQVMASIASALARMGMQKRLSASVIAAAVWAGATNVRAAPGAPVGKTALLAGGLVAALALGGGAYLGERAPSRDGGRAATLAVTANTPLRLAADFAGVRAAAGDTTDVHGAILGGAKDAAGRTIMSFDFEDGVFPSLFTEGLLVAGPARPGNRFCLTAVLLPGHQFLGAIRLGELWGSASVFHYTRTTKVSFDYWATKEWDAIGVQVWNNDKGGNFHISIDDVPVGRWAHAEVSLADFVPRRTDLSTMDEGDGLRTLVFSSGVAGGGAFYVDNIRIVEAPTWDALATGSISGTQTEEKR